MARIRWTEGPTEYSLRNQAPPPADRFSNWVPRSVPVGEFANAQADGALYGATWRTDYGASLELRGIPVRRVAGVSPVDLADRLILHLLQGGRCAVDTEDAFDTTYPVCGLAPGTTPSLTLADERLLEYTLVVSLINLAPAPVRMSCYYKG